MINIKDVDEISDVSASNIKISDKKYIENDKKYTVKAECSKNIKINEFQLTYKTKGEHSDSTLLIDKETKTFCHIIHDIMANANVLEYNEGAEGGEGGGNNNNEGEGISNDEILIPRRVVFIIDKSGSMSGKKWKKVTLSLINALNQLKKGYDKYGIIYFNDTLDIKDIILATNDNIGESIGYINDIKPKNGTNINNSLLNGIKLIKNDIKNTDNNLYYMNQIIFITDGEASIGETNSNKIISNIKKSKDDIKNDEDISIFSFGIGQDNGTQWVKDLNHSFLKNLSLNNNGFYKRIKESTNDLDKYYKILSNPILKDLNIKYNLTNNITNNKFNTLFNGNDIIISGKLNNINDNDKLIVTINGITSSNKNNDNNIKKVKLTSIFEYNIKNNIINDNSIERIWAYLTLQNYSNKNILNPLNNIDKKSALDLALKQSFVTPWTSMIVVDNSNETSKPIKKKDKPKPAADTFRYLKREMAMASAPKPAIYSFTESADLDAEFDEGDESDDDESDGSSDDEYNNNNDDDDDDDDDDGHNYRTMMMKSSFASKPKKKVMKKFSRAVKSSASEYASASTSAAIYENNLMDGLFSFGSSKKYASASKPSTTVDNAMDDLLFDSNESNDKLEMLVTKSAALEYGIESKADENDEKKSDDVVVIIDPASEIELKVNNKGIKLKKQWAKLSSFLNTMIENDPKSKLSIEVDSINKDTLNKIIEYLKYHNGIVSDKYKNWDNKFVNKYDIKTCLLMILGCIELEINSLLKLLCNKIKNEINNLNDDNKNLIKKTENEYRTNNDDDMDGDILISGFVRKYIDDDIDDIVQELSK